MPRFGDGRRRGRSLSPLPRLPLSSTSRAQGDALASAQDGVSALGECASGHDSSIAIWTKPPAAKIWRISERQACFGAILADTEGLEPVDGRGGAPARSPRPRGSPRFMLGAETLAGAGNGGEDFSGPRSSHRTASPPPRHRSQWPRKRRFLSEIGEQRLPAALRCLSRARPVRPGVCRSMRFCSSEALDSPICVRRRRMLFQPV